MIYKCNNPFMSRKGQFEPDKHTLVCGIDETVALTCKGEFVMTLGNSPKQYKMSADKLRTVKHTKWVNPKGKTVWIVPVSEFEPPQEKPKEFCCSDMASFGQHFGECKNAKSDVEKKEKPLF